jgi:hypothetical protein
MMDYGLELISGDSRMGRLELTVDIPTIDCSHIQGGERKKNRVFLMVYKLVMVPTDIRYNSALLLVRKRARNYPSLKFLAII